MKLEERTMSNYKKVLDDIRREFTQYDPELQSLEH